MPFDVLEISRRIRALGREILPAIEPTAALYAPFQEREDYRGVRLSRDIRYGADERNRLDVFAPESAPGAARPVLLFVHGGGFVGGDKHLPGSPYNDNVALWALRHGMIGVNMTYRLAPAHRWPAGAQDVQAALAWVRDKIATFGGNPERVFLLGTSAGAVHVASYVVQPSLHPRGGPGVAGAILLSGMYDLTVAARNPMHLAYFGEDPAQYVRASMREGLLATAVPLLFVLTEMDPPEFQHQTLAMLQAFLTQRGELPGFVYLPGHNHLSSTMHLNSPDAYLGERIRDFIATTAG
ncbi:MAG TPA: alpha/beta hydrolase [Steroidobacteraceae bacterium]|nr:alpha/beta hydrolase [Steroidobacteraceae bacterium]